MNGLITSNMVLQYLDSSAQKIRIIWISTNSEYAFYVLLEGDTCMPKSIKVEQLEIEIASHSLREIHDPFLRVIDEKYISENNKDIRNKNWEVVNYLWNSEEPEVLFKNHRAKCVKEAAKKFGMTELQVKRLLTRFWQQGMNKNALLPSYNNCGGKGKERKVTDKKRGRSSRIGRNGKQKIGINVDEDIKRIFRTIIDAYHNKKDKPSISDSYTHMLEQYFADKFKVNGEVVYKIWPRNIIPTYEQFYHWFYKLTEHEKKKSIISRHSETEFNLKYRELLGNSTMEVFGPGSRYQIDATPADVYLVSLLNRNHIIGRPIVYAVIDVFTRLVTRLHCGLVGPSWEGAMMAIDNVVEDKVQFCKKFGVEITEDDWPCSYLPEVLLADRGEFEGDSPKNLINNIGVKLENTPPYRGDLKGIVERYFRTINEKIKRMTPGAIEKEYRERGDRDYRLDATLTLEEFTKMMIYSVLHHNKKIVEKYPMTQQMVADEIVPTPVNIWQWGVKRTKGRFKKYPRDIVRMNLLPRGRAYVSREGIKFKGMFYSTAQAIKEEWFIRGENGWIDIVYDSRNLGHIYIPGVGGKNFEVCHLLEKNAYKGLFYEEVDFLEQLKNDVIDEVKVEQIQNKVNYKVASEGVIEKAKEKTAKARDKERKSNRAKTKDIRNNRAQEIEMHRGKEAFVLGSSELKDGQIITIDETIKASVQAKKDSKKINNKFIKIRDEELG